MSKYWNTSGLENSDWLWANLKRNPEALLLLAAGGALLLRKRSWSRGTQQEGESVQHYPARRESIADHMAAQGRVGDEANEASRIAENAREHAASLGKKMSETAADYIASVTEYARGTQEKVVDQSRRAR